MENTNIMQWKPLVEVKQDLLQTQLHNYFQEYYSKSLLFNWCKDSTETERVLKAYSKWAQTENVVLSS